jgi:uncharacterized protein involved in exopolysaccharide biosynthesis
MPGTWLLAFARLVFSDAVLTMVIEPTIADMRIEWSDPGSDIVAKLRARFLGYLAFWSVVAISPVAFSRRSGEDASLQIQRSNEMTVASPIRLVLILLIVGLGAGYLYGRAQPVLYRSSATIQVMPPRVPESVMKPSRPTLGERLLTTEAAILSRTRLERVIKEFNLYPEEQKTGIMEDIVARMRREIRTAPLKGDVFQVQYTGSNPITVMKVTERLASLFLEESLKDGQRLASGTLSFLEERIQETAGRLTAVNAELERAGHGASAMPKRLELEVIQNIYKNLLTQREGVLGTQSLQRRQIGEQFVLLDPAQVPQQPIGPPPTMFTLGGGAAGLTVAALLFLGQFVARILRDRKARLSAAAV